MADKTQRGFSYLQFEDLNGRKCSLQMSSLAQVDAIWLGVDYGLDPRDGTPPPHIEDGRMHLTRKEVKRLIKQLKHFVKNSDLP